jgi:hypothetical protein
MTSTAAAASVHTKYRPQRGDLRYGRSKVGNGSELLPGVDGRSVWVRRAREIIADLTADLGGADNVSAAQASLVRRSAVLTVELEQLEAGFATAGCATTDLLDSYQRVTNTLRRTLEAVQPGLERRQREVPSLAEYLARKATQLPADEAAADEAVDQ